jgi:hypothetical protein
VALTAQADRERMHKESHQQLDIVTLFRPVTKRNTSLAIPEIIPEAFRKAFKLAQSEKPGVTHIEIPEDVARLETDGHRMRIARGCRIGSLTKPRLTSQGGLNKTSTSRSRQRLRAIYVGWYGQGWNISGFTPALPWVRSDGGEAFPATFPAPLNFFH